MKKILVIFLLCLVAISGFAQYPDTAFISTFGGIQNEFCNQIMPTYDNGYITIGTTNSFGRGAEDFYAVKVDANGRYQWSNTYGGPLADEGFGVVQTLDSGYAFVGYTENTIPGNGYDVLLVKTDTKGKELWQKTYGGTDWDFGYSIAQLKDSGFVICGQTYSYGAGNGDVYVIRTDKNGDTIWTRAIGGPQYDIGNSICVMDDSIYAINGSTVLNGSGDTNMFFLRLNSNGNVEKQITFGFGGVNHNSIGSSVSVTQDLPSTVFSKYTKGFLLFGYSDSVTSGKPDEIMIQLDSMCNKSWIQDYTESGRGIGKDAIQAPDGTYLTVSSNNTSGLGYCAMQMQHDMAGGWYLSNPSFGGTGYQQGNSVTMGANGSVVFAGASNSPGYSCGLYDFYLVRLENDSMVQNYTVIINNYCDSLSPSSITPVSVEQPGIKIFPSPVISSATILLQGEPEQHYVFNLYNTVGQLVGGGISLRATAHGQYVATLMRNELSSGVYVYEIEDEKGNQVATGKFIIE